jgi:hypothetical protein
VAYATFEEVKKILKTSYLQYPDDITDEIEFAEATVHSHLAGHFDLRFDDVAKYASVPIQIKWITSLLVGWRLIDPVVTLEGGTDKAPGKGWYDEAVAWLKCLASGDCRLTLEDGTLIDTESSLPRSYPAGTRDKADSENNEPWFTRAQAGQW